jgi:hypothetical protein
MCGRDPTDGATLRPSLLHLENLRVERRISAVAAVENNTGSMGKDRVGLKPDPPGTLALAYGQP